MIARNRAQNFCYITPQGQLIPVSPEETSDKWSYRLDQINGFQIPDYAISGKLYMSMEQPVKMKGIIDAAGLTGIVQPELNNESDPNHDIYFEWMEFTVKAPESGQPVAFWGNTTQVDYYTFSYTMEMYEKQGNSYQPFKTVGITDKRDSIFDAYDATVPPEFKTLANYPYRIMVPGKGSFQKENENVTYLDSYNNEVWNYYRSNTINNYYHEF